MSFEAPRPVNATLHAVDNGVSIEAIEEQRARLDADIASVTARKLSAQHRAAQLDAEAKELLRAELASSRDTLAEIERQHAQSVALVHRNAQTEVDRILADAHRQAGSVMAEVATLGTDVR